MKRYALILAALALGAGAAGAQVTPKRFSVVTRLGALTPERAASVETSGLIGLDADYALNKYFGIGTALEIGRGNTHREDFVQRIKFGNPGVAGGDTIYYQYLGQPVNTINVSLMGTARMPGKVSPFVTAGVGTYTMIMDGQTNGEKRSMAGMSLSGGVGINFRFSEKYGMQLDARAIQFQDYNRAKLDPSEGRFPNKWFPEDLPAIPAAKNTALNTAFTLGFRYVPGAGN
jgi:hypothetical protein